MDSGMWTVAGTLIGAAATLLATRLTLKGRTDYFDEKCIRMIEEKFKKEKENDFTISGQVLDEFGKSLGLGKMETRQLLIIAGAKPLDNSGTKWKLT